MVSDQNGSILKQTKKLLGLPDDYDVFDMDIILHINSAFSTLHQLAVGPTQGFSINDDTAIWSEFIAEDHNINSVKSYIFIKVKLLFDPPSTSYAQEALLKQANEYEWRLNVHSEGVKNP